MAARGTRWQSVRTGGNLAHTARPRPGLAQLLHRGVCGGQTSRVRQTRGALYGLKGTPAKHPRMRSRCKRGVQTGARICRPGVPRL